MTEMSQQKKAATIIDPFQVAVVLLLTNI